MKVTTFLAERFETVEALAVVDILRRAGVIVDTVSVTDSLNVTSAQNVTVVADKLYKDADFAGSDVLFLPGGPGHTAFLENEDLLDKLVKHFNSGKSVAAICAAPSVLGRIGILKGKKAMAFPGYEEYLEGATVICAPERVVTDGNVTTSRGMGTSIDLGLELVRILVGEEVADKLAVSIQYR